MASFSLTTISISTFIPPKFTRCSVRTAPANRLWSRRCTASSSRAAANCAGWGRRSPCPVLPRRGRSESAWCSSISLQNPKLLILDEPTAVLTPQEAEQRFIVLDRLRDEGQAILYISHKLEEVKRLCNTATILRGGRKVATCDPPGDGRFSCAHDGRSRDLRSEGRFRIHRHASLSTSFRWNPTTRTGRASTRFRWR
jgi:hypothetical protein